ncbi:MAG TPA: ROK family protein, partial [Flexilinea sp.]|nr:ROK family protein [Flexilinea sp.]
MKYYGAIEAGGTKFVCSILADPDHYFEEVRFPTTTPEETLERTVSFFKEQRNKYELTAIGVSCFGPIDLNPSSPTYGYITTTPKIKWRYTNIVGFLKQELNLPVGFDTDVNGAALAEYKWGNPENIRNLVYYTVGTGVGGGVVIDGKPVHGLVHPEAGHILIRQNLEKDPFKGDCPYHGNCLEGLCAG